MTSKPTNTVVPFCKKTYMIIDYILDYQKNDIKDYQKTTKNVIFVPEN